MVIFSATFIFVSSLAQNREQQFHLSYGFGIQTSPRYKPTRVPLDYNIRLQARDQHSLNLFYRYGFGKRRRFFATAGLEQLTNRFYLPIRAEYNSAPIHWTNAHFIYNTNVLSVGIHRVFDVYEDNLQFDLGINFNYRLRYIKNRFKSSVDYDYLEHIIGEDLEIDPEDFSYSQLPYYAFKPFEYRAMVHNRNNQILNFDMHLNLLFRVNERTRLTLGFQVSTDSWFLQTKSEIHSILQSSNSSEYYGSLNETINTFNFISLNVGLLFKLNK